MTKGIRYVVLGARRVTTAGRVLEISPDSPSYFTDREAALRLVSQLIDDPVFDAVTIQRCD